MPVFPVVSRCSALHSDRVGHSAASTYVCLSCQCNKLSEYNPVRVWFRLLLGSEFPDILPRSVLVREASYCGPGVPDVRTVCASQALCPIRSLTFESVPKRLRCDRTCFDKQHLFDTVLIMANVTFSPSNLKITSRKRQNENLSQGSEQGRPIESHPQRLDTEERLNVLRKSEARKNSERQAVNPNASRQARTGGYSNARHAITRKNHAPSNGCLTVRFAYISVCFRVESDWNSGE